jgi:hypothetical protein
VCDARQFGRTWRFQERYILSKLGAFRDSTFCPSLSIAIAELGFYEWVSESCDANVQDMWDTMREVS